MSVESQTSSMFCHFNERLEQIIKKRKRIEYELHGGPSEYVQSLVKNLKLDDLEEKIYERQGRVFSNDMIDACKTICKVCQAQVTLNYMRTHTKIKHRMTISEYKDLFGNHRDHIVKEVYHKCGLCQEEILLDGDRIHLHVRKHKISLKEYSSKYIIETKASPKRKSKEAKNEQEDDVLNSIKTKAFDVIDKGDLDTIQEIEAL